MDSHAFIMYLLYGAVYIYLGIFSLSQKQETLSQNVFVKSLYLLGLFGLLHGISEWINVVLLAGVYTSWSNQLLIIKQLFKAISFVCLAFFGLKLIDLNKLYRKGRILTVMIFSLWFIGFLYWMRSPIRIESPFYSVYNTILLRYLLAFLSALVTSIGFYRRSKILKLQKNNRISSEYFNLSIILLIYAIVEGILIKEQFFFPANLINREVFLEVFKIPVQAIKIVIGIYVNVSLARIVNSFYWEQYEKINQLVSDQAIYHERQRMSLEIHDGIMQNIYAIGMKVEVIIKHSTDIKYKNVLVDVKENLNQTLLTLRHLISVNTIKTVDFQHLREQVESLIDQYKMTTTIQFQKHFNAPIHLIKKISEQKSTHIYYIIQEAIINGIKHSNAKNISVIVNADKNIISIIVEDDGIGFNIDHIGKDSYGISLMKNRVADLKASIKIDSSNFGTRVNIVVPWEDIDE